MKELWKWVMVGGWKSFKVHVRRSLDCLKEIVGKEYGLPMKLVEKGKFEP